MYGKIVKKIEYNEILNNLKFNINAMEENMEIEKKYKIRQLPENLKNYPNKKIEQGYLCTNPIVRIRKSNSDYILTYKSKYGLDEKLLQVGCVSNEVEVPLSKEGYEHLKEKVDNYMICKTRYIIPLEDGLKAELDIFEGRLTGLIFVEVEFPSSELATTFKPPIWFGEDVSFDNQYKNNYLATVENVRELGILS